MSAAGRADTAGASSARRYLALSAHQIDPLSWFTGPIVPAIFAGLNILYGGVLAAVAWANHGSPHLQIAGVVIATAACLFVQLMTRPMRPRVDWRTGLVAILIASFGFVLSALGYAGTSFSIDLWWAPFGVALTLASLAPYLPARSLLSLGVTASVLTAVTASVIIGPRSENWGPVATVLIVTSPILCATVAAAAFSYVIVSRMLPLLERRSSVLVSDEAGRDDAAEAAERMRLAQLTARVVPFLEGIAASGTITPLDRNLAGQLARRLRDDLVTQSHLTWLDSVAVGTRLVVIDPDQRANRMRASQRTALRALLQAILDTPGTDAGSLLVELRAGEDGSTAVGVSLDMELPEGRRVMHLAPYYLTLGTAVQDLQWSRDRFLRLSFNLPEDTPPLG